MKIPTKSDWGVIDKKDLDARCAFKQFAGKSLKQAEELFQDNALYYQEDLLSMPAIAFNCYAPMFAKYLLSEKARDDSDGASSFLHMLIELFQGNPSLVTSEVKTVLLDAASKVAGKQRFYEADTDIYGNFSDLHKKIIQLSEQAP